MDPTIWVLVLATWGVVIWYGVQESKARKAKHKASQIKYWEAEVIHRNKRLKKKPHSEKRKAKLAEAYKAYHSWKA